MANSTRRPPTTPFSQAFAVALREVMAARGVVQTKVAAAINRDQTFVSERTSGKRPCDTDIIAGIAEVAGVSPRTIVSEVLAAMKRNEGGRGQGGSVTPIKPDASPAPQGDADPVVKKAARKPRKRS